MEQFVWLCTANNDAEAGMIQGVLENEGILVQLSGRGARQLYGLNSFFGADIQVPESDKARARELLRAYFPEGAADVAQAPEQTE